MPFTATQPLERNVVLKHLTVIATILACIPPLVEQVGAVTRSGTPTCELWPVLARMAPKSARKPVGELSELEAR